jgi:hypothetical protein
MEVTKNNMFSGTWIAVIEGLTFAYMRSFEIIAAPPATVTNTPTATFTVTSVPSTTITTTLTSLLNATASALTITLPSSASTRTITTTPAPATTYWTSTITRTRTTRVFSKTVSTATVTTSCQTQTPTQDPTCTIRPTKATLAATNPSITVAPRLGRFPQRPGQSNWNKWGGHKLAMIRRDGGASVESGPGTSLSLQMHSLSN